MQYCLLRLNYSLCPRKKIKQQRKLNKKPIKKKPILILFNKCKSIAVFAGTKLISKFKNSVIIKATFISTILLLVTYFYLNNSKAKEIRGEIILDGNIAINYSASQSDLKDTLNRITPLCGCLMRRPHQGLMFFSREYDIKINANEDSDSLFYFYITSPFSDMYPDPYFEFNCIIAEVEKNNLWSFLNEVKFIPDSNGIENDSIIFNEKYLKKVTHYDNLGYIGFYNRGSSVKFKHFGETPISALMPLKNSHIEIDKIRSPYDKIYSGFLISQTYEIEYDSTGANVPMLDALGPLNCFAADITHLHINRKLVPYEKQSPDNVTVIFSNTAFSNRFMFYDAPREQFDSANVRPIDLWLPFGNGSFTLTVNNPLNDTEYDTLKKVAEENALISRMAKEYGIDLRTGMLAYPQLSSTNGIYFYSHYLANLYCENASGDLRFGKEHYSLVPDREIEIKDMNRFLFYDEPVIFPLNKTGDNTELISKFSGEGKLYLDGDYVKVNIWDTYILQWIIGIISIISFVVLIFQLLKPAKNP